MIGLWLVLAAWAGSPRDRVVKEVLELRAEVERTRGLAFRFDVPVSVETPDEVVVSLRDELHTSDATAEFEALDATLRAFRLDRGTGSLQEQYLAVMQGDLAGYYDPDDGRLVVVGRGNQFRRKGLGEEERATASHELVHALQDQHFDLWTLMERDLYDDDVAIALQALVEGDATLAMISHVAPGFEKMVSAMPASALAGMLSTSADVDVGAMASAPPVLRRSLMFPYLQGMGFAVALFKAGEWDAVNAAYRAPPLSSEQILHPERRATDWPVRLDLRPLVLVDGWTARPQNTLGEFGIVGLLEEYGLDADAAATAAAGWGGDRYEVFTGPGDAVAARWATTWDTEKDAEQFEQAIAAWAHGVAGVERSGDRWVVGDRTWLVVRDGLDVNVLVDLPSAWADAALASLTGLSRRTLRTLDEVGPPTGEPRAGGALGPG